MKFKFYDGDLMGLPVNEHHLVVRWQEPNTKILFSFTQLGTNVISLHIATKDATFEQGNQAIRDMIDFIKNEMYGIDKIIGLIRVPKLASRVVKLGFKFVGVVELEDHKSLLYEYNIKREEKKI